MRNGCPVNFGKLIVEERIKFLGKFGIGSFPCGLFGTASLYNLTELFTTSLIKSLHILEYNPWILGIGTKISHSGSIVGTRCAEGLAVSRALSLEARSVGLHTPSAHHSVTYDDGGTFLLALSLGNRLCDLFRIIAVTLKHLPSPCTILRSYILVVDLIDHSGELHLIAVIEHYKVAETEMSGQTACALGYLLLNTAIGNESICLVAQPLAETGCKETLSDSAAYSHSMTLAKRPGSVLHSTLGVKLGMAWRRRAPLTELLKFVDSIMSEQSEDTVEHR